MVIMDLIRRQKKMDYLSHNVAVNLKSIRRAKGMSLDVVSEQTGVSKSMLAQIEKGSANPSLGVLGKIVSGLRIEFNDLIRTPLRDTVLIRVDETVPTKEVEDEYRVWTCFPIEDNNIVEIYRIEIEPGKKYISGSHGEKTREYISVLEGEVTVWLENSRYVITKEDVFRFESDRDHRYINESKEKVVFMSFFVAY